MSAFSGRGSMTLLLLLIAISLQNSHAFHTPSRPFVTSLSRSSLTQRQPQEVVCWPSSSRSSNELLGFCRHVANLKSSKDDDDIFYDDFEDFGDDNDDDDDDEYSDFDVSGFRSKMENIMGDEDEDDDSISESDTDLDSESSIDELISLATSPASSTTSYTATPISIPSSSKSVNSLLVPGSVLIANPDHFCSKPGGWGGTINPSPSLLSKFGLTLPPPADLGPDRQADLLPVLIVLDFDPVKGYHGLLLNRRTGYLIGDLEQNHQSTTNEDEQPETPRLGAFMIQPLWFGGTSSASSNVSPTQEMASDGNNNGLDMLHLCPKVDGCRELDGGLYWGGDVDMAQDAMEEHNGNNQVGDKLITGFDFKFFVQSTRWSPSQLEKEVSQGIWFVAQVSKDVIFKSRDRLGTKRAKPLWTDIMELLGDDFKQIRDDLYSE